MPCTSSAACDAGKTAAPPSSAGLPHLPAGMRARMLRYALGHHEDLGIWAMSQVAHDRLYRRHRFPAEVIAHAVWLYFRFPLPCAWWRTCWRLVASSSRIRPFEPRRRNRAAFRQKDQTTVSRPVRRQMASRLMRGSPSMARSKALARRGRLRSRRPGANRQKCQGCKAADAQVAKSSRACTTGDDH